MPFRRTATRVDVGDLALAKWFESAAKSDLVEFGRRNKGRKPGWLRWIGSLSRYQEVEEGKSDEIEAKNRKKLAI